VTLLDDAKATFLTTTAVAGEKITYQCDAGTSFVENLEAEFRNTQELECTYSGSLNDKKGGVNLEGYQDLKACRGTLL